MDNISRGLCVGVTLIVLAVFAVGGTVPSPTPNPTPSPTVTPSPTPTPAPTITLSDGHPYTADQIEKAIKEATARVNELTAERNNLAGQLYELQLQMQNAQRQGPPAPSK
jgi:hypothetical protein